jgi:hypothetical protein
LVGVLRGLGSLAVWIGYAWARSRLALATARAGLFPARGWRIVTIGQVALRVPPQWGELEADVGGGYVLHNRPRRLRIDGDAVWYGSAIELRIRKPDGVAPAPATPMAEFTKELPCPGGPVVLVLAMANGVSQQARRVALEVFRIARVDSRQPPIAWDAPAPRVETGGVLFHPRKRSAGGIISED